ncbi:MAG: PAS domain-containing protein, partial [Curvibacter sp.]|nr:PAS domain-containing protein [Curvibacter sp.]
MPHTTELQAPTLDALPTAAMVVQAGRVVHANPACQQLLEATRAADVLGRPMSDFVHPLDQARA